MRYLIHLFHTLHTYTTQPTLHTGFSTNEMQRFPGTKVNIAGSEPLIQEADPHITKLTVELGCRIKDGPKKIGASFYI